MKTFRRFLIALFLSTPVFFISCSSDEPAPILQKLSAVETGITFSNTITTSDSSNAENEVFIYNGAGVAAGDLNNDGLTDLYFTGNRVSSRLYMNRGDMQFEDVTENAGAGTERWATGVSMVDINNDGYLDIYVSISHATDIPSRQRRNLLFINNGDETFSEQAADYGIDDSGFTTHSAFLDYDLDGDLDLFLLNNSPEEFSRGEIGIMPLGAQQDANPSGYDQLYKNNGDGSFSNVSEEAGILRKLGYGLGVAVSDLNGDNWPDIYVSNDITPSDVLYINNGDGTFTDRAGDWLRHTSHAGMGIDIADYTNNGWPDILQSDMMPENLAERKLMSGANSYSGFADLRKRGFYPDYNINTLQMNQGVTETGGLIFSEVARMAGVAYTHWSWTSLFTDLDNDGLKDIFITNGYPKAMNDFDYLSDMHLAGQTDSEEEAEAEKLKILRNLHSYKISNYLFRNNADGTFTDLSQAWGMDTPGFSYGAVYADLDNDGRLDLVVNNINAEASVYHNTGTNDGNSSHYLAVQLEGPSPNMQGIGAKLWLWTDGKQQFKYQSPYRGFMSFVDPRLHFGLGNASKIDSLQIRWPDGRSQVLREISANQKITIHHSEASSSGPSSPNTRHSGQIFNQIPSAESISHTDVVSEQADYSVQPLLPYMVSRQGPALTAGDVDGDGREDLFIGGSDGTGGTLYIQQPNGQFTESDQPQPWRADSDQTDWDAEFIDVNGNGHLDLYIASGGYHSSPVSLLLQDRLYINYGDGRFLKDTDFLPEMLTSTATIAPGDFNGDGRIDLFVGGRLTPRNWPAPTRSWLLRNDGDRFTDVTQQMAPQLIEPGSMITDALWVDIDKNGQDELLTVGQWTGIQFYRFNGQEYEEITASMDLPPLRGWWESLATGDFNRDGYPDLAVGNLGLNHTYTATPERPFGVAAVDMTGNQTTDIILTQEIDGTEYPLYGLAKLGRDIYTVGIAFNSFKSFSEASVEQVVSSDKLERAFRYQADTFASVVLLSDGHGGYSVQQLPSLAQISPIRDIVAADVDQDGHTDLIIGGNLYESEPTAPRADAGNGLWLRGDGSGQFMPVPPLESGLLIPGDVRDLALIETPNGPQLIVTNNADSTQVFKINSSN